MSPARRVPVELWLCLLIMAVAAIYWPGLAGQLVLDDLPNLEPFKDLSTGAIEWTDVAFKNDSGLVGRPVAMLSFLADYYLGDGLVRQFKLTNLALHLVCGVVLFLIARCLYAVSDVEPDKADYIALGVCAVWLTAPLFASTVLYIVQRMAQLATLFSLLGMLCYIKGRILLLKAGEKSPVWFVVAYLVCCPLAILSKENGVLLTAFLFLLELYWFRFSGSARDVRFLKSLHTVMFIFPVLLGTIWLAARLPEIRDSYGAREFTMNERLLTEGRVLWDYLRQLVMPDGIRMGVTHDDFPVSKGLLSPPSTAVALIGWMAVASLAVALRSHPIASPLAFAMSFFLVGHVVEGTVFPLELYFEHRNYLPATGFLIGGALFVAKLLRPTPHIARLWPLILLFPAVTGFITFQRAMAWQSPEALARMAEYAHPRSSRLQTALVSMHILDGNLGLAMQSIDRMAEIEGGHNLAHALQTLEAYCYLKYQPTSSDYGRVISYRTIPRDRIFLRMRVKTLGDLILAGRCATIDFSKISPLLGSLAEDATSNNDWLLLLYTGRLFMSLDRIPEAIKALDLADRIDRSRLEPWLIKAQILLKQGNFAEAEHCIRSLESRIKYAVAYQREMIASLKERLVERIPAASRGEQEMAPHLAN